MTRRAKAGWAEFREAHAYCYHLHRRPRSWRLIADFRRP